MAQQSILAGPGQGLPPPQQLYPTWPSQSLPSFTPGANEVNLAAGQELPIPAGTWLVNIGSYSVLQWLDPVTTIWRGFSSVRQGPLIVNSDGFTRRVANLTGCPIAAVVTTAGSGYAQGTATCTSNAGGSTWIPIIGGLLTLNTISVAGSGYTIPPLCIIPAPPAPGVQATAVAALSSGTVNTITITDQGAGYTQGYTITLLPNPTDPGITTITNAVAIVGTTGAGTLAAVLCTNNGTSGSTVTTLTIGGTGGSNAAATAVMMFTAVSETITANGAGYQNNGQATSVGGQTAATATHTNPSVEISTYVPRPFVAQYATAGTLNTITSITTVYDSGIFTGTPVSSIIGGAVTTLASITFGLGGKPDTVIIQPL